MTSAVRIVALASAALLLVGCGGAGASTGASVSPTGSILPPATDASPAETSSGTALSSDSTSPGAVSSPVVGVIVAIDSAGLSEVTGFTLRLSGGSQLRFRVLAPLENGAQFPLGHLSEHLATAAPVRVFFRRSADLLVVYRIEDAG